MEDKQRQVVWPHSVWTTDKLMVCVGVVAAVEVVVVGAVWREG